MIERIKQIAFLPFICISTIFISVYSVFCKFVNWVYYLVKSLFTWFISSIKRFFTWIYCSIKRFFSWIVYSLKNVFIWIWNCILSFLYLLYRVILWIEYVIRYIVIRTTLFFFLGICGASRWIILQIYLANSSIARGTVLYSERFKLWLQSPISNRKGGPSTNSKSNSFSFGTLSSPSLKKRHKSVKLSIEMPSSSPVPSPLISVAPTPIPTFLHSISSSSLFDIAFPFDNLFYSRKALPPPPDNTQVIEKLKSEIEEKNKIISNLESEINLLLSKVRYFEQENSASLQQLYIVLSEKEKYIQLLEKLQSQLQNLQQMQARDNQNVVDMLHFDLLKLENEELKFKYFNSLFVAAKLEHVKEGRLFNIDSVTLYEKAKKEKVDSRIWSQWIETELPNYVC